MEGDRHDDILINHVEYLFTVQSEICKTAQARASQSGTLNDAPSKS
jgi:hypothetical protein